jgi:hypothetical protein
MINADACIPNDGSSGSPNPRIPYAGYSDAPIGAIVRQEHGGALRKGNPGNRGGYGRPRKRIFRILMSHAVTKEDSDFMVRMKFKEHYSPNGDVCWYGPNRNSEPKEF